jgi:eukaryotic-like serine/threonine-protein kinase
VTDHEGAISGRISDRPVADLFQWLHETRRSGVARFRTALGTATVWFRDGELVDADMGRFHQDAAVLRLMRIFDGEYEVEPKPVNQRRAIKQSTAVLLAEGRQRAPRPGPPRAPSAPSGEYSLVRDELRPRARTGEPAGTGAAEPRRGGRSVDTGAHTVLNAKAPPRPPGWPASTAPAPSVSPAPASAAVEPPATPRVPSSAASESPGPVRGPAARRRGLGWSPTAGGLGQAPEPTPSARSASMVPGRPATDPPVPTAAPPEAGEGADASPRSGRTRFMFGVSGPAAEREPASPPTPGAVTTPVPPDDSARSPGEGPRRRARPAARAQVPFEPERTDRTLLRPGPLPPPPGQPVVLPQSPSQAIPVGGPPGAAQAIGGASPVVPAPARPTAPLGSNATPLGAPVLVDEEYSHPISVPTVPTLATAPLGPGGTWVLGSPDPNAKPLPDDPDAEQTISMRAPDVPQPREPALSSRVKAGGTAHVGRYEVLLRLARGGMGTVYLCRVTGEGGFRRLFALKVIRDHLNTNHAYVQMLLDEAHIASRLSHPNIVSIIDIDTFAGQHYLVMDYVEGCTFSELLKAHPGARPPDLIVPIVLDALTGLHAAHSMRDDDGSPHPVVHCDFSPQNMLVGVNGTCRITDFGVSKAAHALPSGPGRGKPGYLSPEQVRGLPLDPRSDVFSAGVVLWNALTGESLFDGDDPQAVMHQVVTRQIPKPSAVGLRPPACFDRICLRALERDPARRYQSAEQMLTELRKVAIAEDLLAPSSAVGQWVQETFGAQIELRRQAAGLQPNPIVSALALRDLALVGPAMGAASGHSQGSARDGSVTGHDPDASMTMMLQAGPVPDRGAHEGLAARTRVVVMVAALAFIAAGVATLFVRPDLLQGGIIDEHGQYIDLTVPADREPLTGTDGAEPQPAAEGDGTTGAAPEPAVAGATAGDTDPDDDTNAEPTGEPEPAPAAADDGKAKPKPGKGKPSGAAGSEPQAPAKPSKPGDDTKAAKPRPKPKGDASNPAAPPPDLDELFRPPGS